MKQVIVRPQRCVGCMQCMIACAAAHSQSRDLFFAVNETPAPRPRIHVGAGSFEEGFPNRCRHCNPAPCMAACLPGAIYRHEETGSVLIDPALCINCASCAMACPYGVIRYHSDPAAPEGREVAVKCDNCIERQIKGMIPACVEACKTGALTFEETGDAMKRITDEVARTCSQHAQEQAKSPGFALLNAVKKSRTEINTSR